MENKGPFRFWNGPLRLPARKGISKFRKKEKESVLSPSNVPRKKGTGREPSEAVRGGKRRNRRQKRTGPNPHPPSPSGLNPAERIGPEKRRNHRQKRTGPNPHPPSSSGPNPAKRIGPEKRRNSQHSAVCRPQAGNGAVLGISELVDDTGLEPVTPCTSSRCSSQLS